MKPKTWDNDFSRKKPKSIMFTIEATSKQKGNEMTV
jgi:hypothetical protein